MAFREIERPSPNREARRHERLGAMFHHSELSFDATVERMLQRSSQVSYHCLIGLDGTRCVLVPDNEVAWHAGASSFMGRNRCNDFMLGVSFAGDTYEAPLSDAQLASALEWLSRRWRALGWSPEVMTDHRQASPGRKRDLNPLEWDRLIAAIRSRFQPAAPPKAFPG